MPAVELLAMALSAFGLVALMAGVARGVIVFADRAEERPPSLGYVEQRTDARRAWFQRLRGEALRAPREFDTSTAVECLACGGGTVYYAGRWRCLPCGWAKAEPVDELQVTAELRRIDRIAHEVQSAVRAGQHCIVLEDGFRVTRVAQEGDPANYRLLVEGPDGARWVSEAEVRNAEGTRR